MAIKIGQHTCVTIVPRDTDFFSGDGHVLFKSNMPSGDWTPYFHWNERQKFSWDCEDCVCFAAQKIVDAEIDWLIATGQVGQDVISHLTALGFMDNGHFHSSERWLGSLTGNGFNGNPLYAPYDVIRKYGMLPWNDLPFDATTTQADYLITPTQAQLDKAKAILQYFTFQYHWVVDNGQLTGTPITKMKTALQQSPLQIGINVCNASGGWDQVNPNPCADLSPQHSVAVIKMDTATSVSDQYNPFVKHLPFSWNVGYVLQAIVSPVPQIPNPPPQPPVIASKPPTIDDKQAVVGWLQVVQQWLLNYLSLNPKVGSITFDPNMSKFLSLNSYDVLKGVVVAVLAPVFAYVGQSLQAAATGGTFSVDWGTVAKIAATAFMAYLTKNWLTNSQGSFLGTEMETK